MPQIAGVLALSTVMTSLSADRPVFHSEADFQFAFAQAVAAAEPSMQVRLEVRQPTDRTEYVDLVCWTQQGRTVIELKYATAGWEGIDPHGEPFKVRNHAAYDLARRYYVHDIYRLEHFTAAQRGTDGLAIMLTNERGLWDDRGRPTSRDINFRIHEGQTLTDHLVWGRGDTPQYDRRLQGTYTTQWRDYSEFAEPKTQFRWLALAIPAHPC